MFGLGKAVHLLVNARVVRRREKKFGSVEFVRTTRCGICLSYIELRSAWGITDLFGMTAFHIRRISLVANNNNE